MPDIKGINPNESAKAKLTKNVAELGKAAAAKGGLNVVNPAGPIINPNNAGPAWAWDNGSYWMLSSDPWVKDGTDRGGDLVINIAHSLSKEMVQRLAKINGAVIKGDEAGKNWTISVPKAAVNETKQFFTSNNVKI